MGNGTTKRNFPRIGEANRKLVHLRKMALAYNEGFSLDDIGTELGTDGEDVRRQLVEYVTERRKHGHTEPRSRMVEPPMRGHVHVFLDDMRRKYTAGRRPERPYDGTLDGLIGKLPRGLESWVDDKAVVSAGDEPTKGPARLKDADTRLELLFAVHTLTGLLERFLTSERDSE